MKNDLRKRRLYFGLVLLLQALVFGYLLLTRRLPKGHDTQSVFLLQYLYLSQASPGGVELWLPWLAHGVVSTWFTNLQSGLLQNVLLLAGGVPEGTPMLPVFYAGLFLEDLVLLLGVWRLGGRFYRTPAAQFFVALAALGSSMWISNLYWNHRLLYAVPLAISLLLDVLETGSRGKLFLAVSLLALQTTGNALFIPLLSMLAIGLFLGIHVLLHRRQLRLSLPLLRPRPSDAAWLAALALVVASVAVVLTRGLDSIRQYHAGRNPDGSVSLDSFLTYAGSANPLRYLDLLLGLTPSNDYSLYCGLSTVLLALLAFLHRPGKKVVTLALCLLLLLFFSMGYLSWVGMAGYYAVYPLHYFRYVSLAAPLVKLFLILLAGFGVDAFAQPRGRPGTSFARAGLSLVGLLLAGILLSVLAPFAPFFRSIGDGLALRPDAPPAPFLVGALVVAIAAAGLFLRRIGPGRARTLLPILLLLQGADVFRWRIQVLREETLPLSDPLYEIQRVRPLPYVARRSAAGEETERSRLFGREVFDSGAGARTTYDYADAFLHRDPIWSRYYVTQWSPSMDLLLRARGGQSLIPDDEVPPPLRDLPEPARDKLQVFSTAHRVASDAEIAELLRQSEFRGDRLFLSAPGERGDASFPAKDERLAATPKVLEFAANRLRVEVESPSEAWLLNGDAWHPDWTATVDGVPVPLERANLAYKAVRLHAGRNVVEFRFSAPLRTACARGVGLLSLFWCLVLVAWTLAELRTRSRAAHPPAA